MSTSSPPPPTRTSRRRFLASTLSAGGALLAGCRTTPRQGELAIIDAHTHFYDPARPQGVPWPPSDDAVLYRRVLPDEFHRLARPLGVRATVVVEASSWLEDNQWVLDLAASDRRLVGLVGNLRPGRPEFAMELRRFAGHPRFRGLRLGSTEVRRALTDSPVRRDLQDLAAHDLAIDVLVGPGELEGVAALAGALPNLRVVVDHNANVPIDGGPPPKSWLDGMTACARHAGIVIKVSGLVEGTGRADGSAPAETDFYRPILDAVLERFGTDRVLFGSNWPVSARFADYATVFRIVQRYFAARGPGAERAYFHDNARRVYRLRVPGDLA